MKFFDVSIPVSLYRFRNREAVLGDQGKPSTGNSSIRWQAVNTTIARTVLPGHRLIAPWA
jgi:hypothetical protein